MSHAESMGTCSDTAYSVGIGNVRIGTYDRSFLEILSPWFHTRLNGDFDTQGFLLDISPGQQHESEHLENAAREVLRAYQSSFQQGIVSHDSYPELCIGLLPSEYLSHALLLADFL